MSSRRKRRHDESVERKTSNSRHQNDKERHNDFSKHRDDLKHQTNYSKRGSDFEEPQSSSPHLNDCKNYSKHYKNNSKHENSYSRDNTHYESVERKTSNSRHQNDRERHNDFSKHGNDLKHQTNYSKRASDFEEPQSSSPDLNDCKNYSKRYKNNSKHQNDYSRDDTDERKQSSSPDVRHQKGYSKHQNNYLTGDSDNERRRRSSSPEVSSHKNYSKFRNNYSRSDRDNEKTQNFSPELNYHKDYSEHHKNYSKYQNDFSRHDSDCEDRETTSPKEVKRRRMKYEKGLSDETQRRREENTPSTDVNRKEVVMSPKESAKEIPASKTKMGTINMRSGGAYIPPAKLKMMQEQITDKGSIEYQRIAWEALKKSLIGLTNKVNASNIKEIVFELFKENVIRGRGVLARAIMQAQSMSPTFTHVYAALVAIINTKFPQISELILKRLIIQFKRSFRRNDKQVCVPVTRFIAHLLNQQVAHEVVVLEILSLLLESPTEDSVEISIAMSKECGKKLTELSKRGISAIFERLRNLLHEGNLDKRVQYMIEVIIAIRKDGFKDHQPIPEELDLVEEGEKFTHLITLEEATEPEDLLNVFKFDPDYIANEERYRSIEKELLGEGDSDDSGSSGGESDSEGSDAEEQVKKEEGQKILDMTETNLTALRRNIYLTIQSSLDFEECAHKLLKLEFTPGEIMEMCYMILDCCSQQRTYEKFYGLLAQRFCQLNKIYVEPFTEIFKISYETIHRLETNKLRNVAKFFAHLLYTDAISWLVLSCIRLNEDDTTSSSRIFIKILFQELCEYMGLTKLNNRVKDVTLQEAFDGLFPRDNPRNTRFAINFFTSIGLGGLTDELREHLKSAPKTQNTVKVPEVNNEVALSPSSSSSESSSDSSESEDSDDSMEQRKKRRKKEKDSKSKSSKTGNQSKSKHKQKPGKGKHEKTHKELSRNQKKRKKLKKH